MTSRRAVLENAIFVIGSIIFALILLMPGPDTPMVYYLTTLAQASSTLKGHAPPSDLAQDIVGFRALVRQQDPYPVLGPAVRELGLEWEIGHTSTHPPTCFLLVAPIAFLPWNWASAIWAWLMLVLLIFAFRCYGLSWKVALGLVPLALLWPPIATSLGQMTIIWLFALAAGWRSLGWRSAWSGISIGVASLTKFFPGLLTVILILKRQWGALLGFTSIWAAALLFLLYLHPGSLSRYLQVNQSTSPAMIERADNASLLVNSYRYGGWVGVAGVVIFFVMIVWANRRCFNDPEADPSPRLWMLISYFSIALLPVFWIYSPAPLLPIIMALISRKKLSTMTVGYLCIALPFLIPPYGIFAVPVLVLENLLVGAGLFFDALPFRVFTAATLKELADFKTGEGYVESGEGAEGYANGKLG